MLQKIKKFILETNEAGYASGNSGVQESDGSKIIAYEKGDWKYHDNYFGGEPYGGREVIFYQRKAVWMMVYYGRVLSEVPCETIYPFLQEALRVIPEDNPYRGDLGIMSRTLREWSIAIPGTANSITSLAKKISTWVSSTFTMPDMPEDWSTKDVVNTTTAREPLSGRLFLHISMLRASFPLLKNRHNHLNRIILTILTVFMKGRCSDIIINNMNLPTKKEMLWFVSELIDIRSDLKRTPNHIADMEIAKILSKEVRYKNQYLDCQAKKKLERRLKRC